jgi:hypothetical protein
MGRVSRRSALRSSVALAVGAIAWQPNLIEGFAGLGRALSESSPNLKFPTAALERLSVATWPFRAEIESARNEYRDKKKPGMDLRDFAVKIRDKFGVSGVEPLSAHFSSTDEAYVKGFREGLEKAGMHVVNIPVDNQFLRCGCGNAQKGGGALQEMGGHRRDSGVAERTDVYRRSKEFEAQCGRSGGKPATVGRLCIEHKYFGES